MTASTTAASFDIQHLAQAMRHSSALDAVPLNLQDAQWRNVADYLQPVSLQQGQVLILYSELHESVDLLTRQQYQHLLQNDPATDC